VTWNLSLPDTPARWAAHLRIIHGVWISATGSVEDAWEAHQAYHASPAQGHVPHTHLEKADSDEGDHGFW
jgi:hypothetical protein